MDGVDGSRIIDAKGAIVIVYLSFSFAVKPMSVYVYVQCIVVPMHKTSSIVHMDANFAQQKCHILQVVGRALKLCLNCASANIIAQECFL